jgi:hypothetical protein
MQVKKFEIGFMPITGDDISRTTKGISNATI